MCGFKDSETLRYACENGADAIGLNFCASSRRYVNIDTARALARCIPSFVSTVALFVNADASSVKEVVAEVPVNTLQFHGSEAGAFCEQFAVPYIKAIGIAPQAQSEELVFEHLLAQISEHPRATGFLLDTKVGGTSGGTGQRFDWAAIAKVLAREPLAEALSRQSLIIAGGLTPDNALECASAFAPHALDVSSGIESSPGEKSREKILAFMKSVSTLR